VLGDSVYTQPDQPPTVGVPDIGYQKTGTNVAPAQAADITNSLIAQQMEAWKAQYQAQIDTVAEKVAKCSWYQTKDAATGKCVVGGITLVILAAGGAALLVYLKR
jgi:hypothetical protein